jgi:hypothetical protein
MFFHNENTRHSEFNILTRRFFDFFHLLTFPKLSVLFQYIRWKELKSLYVQTPYTIVRTPQKDNLTLNSERYMTAFSLTKTQSLWLLVYLYHNIASSHTMLSARFGPKSNVRKSTITHSV